MKQLQQTILLYKDIIAADVVINIILQKWLVTIVQTIILTGPNAE